MNKQILLSLLSIALSLTALALVFASYLNIGGFNDWVARWW